MGRRRTQTKGPRSPTPTTTVGSPVEPKDEVEAKLAARGFDLSDTGILLRHVNAIRATGSDGARMLAYMRTREKVHALHLKRTQTPEWAKGALLPIEEDDDHATHGPRWFQPPVVLFHYEDRLRAFELFLFGSVLTLPRHDAALIHLGAAMRAASLD